jgi:hypothetical protein
MFQAGFVYIMFMPEMPHCLKVGCTNRDPRVRAAELSGTSTPLPFRVLMEWRVENMDAAEQAAHVALSAYRVADNREFFRVPEPEAIRLVGLAIRPFLSKVLSPELQNAVGKACSHTGLFVKDYRPHPPAAIPQEVTEHLEKQIYDRSLDVAQWLAEDDVDPSIVLSLIDLVAYHLAGPLQYRVSPVDIQKLFDSNLGLLASLTLRCYYEAVAMPAQAGPALHLATAITQTIGKLLREENVDEEE